MMDNLQVHESDDLRTENHLHTSDLLSPERRADQNILKIADHGSSIRFAQISGSHADPARRSGQARIFPIQSVVLAIRDEFHS